MDAKSPPDKLRSIAGGNTTPTPRKLSDLLTAFGASPSPTSSSSLRKQMQSRVELNSMAKTETKAGDTNFPPPPALAPSAAVADREKDSQSHDELHGGDVIKCIVPVLLLQRKTSH
jgi:hypothetical protein